MQIILSTLHSDTSKICGTEMQFLLLVKGPAAVLPTRAELNVESLDQYKIQASMKAR